jgi:hypothetical protein
MELMVIAKYRYTYLMLRMHCTHPVLAAEPEVTRREFQNKNYYLCEESIDAKIQIQTAKKTKYREK